MLYEKGFLGKCLLTGFIVCISALGWVPGVSAEEHEKGSAAAPIVLEEVVVVGTRFQERSITDSPVPVDVIRREEILKTGQHEVGRAIQRLIPSFNFSSSSISDGTDALRPATLRGMGPDQVLVLVNGKRRHGSALIHVNRSVGRGTAGTDLNAIPLGAIKRIEVLRDGASAQYGSDAIAGVINIVLKDDDEGGVRASYGTTYEGDGDQYVASLDKGFKIGKDGMLHATFEYRNRGRTNRAGLSANEQYPDTVTCSLSDCKTSDLPNKTALLGNNPGNTTVILSDPGDKEKNFNRRNFRIGDGDSEQFSGALNFEQPIDALWSGAELYSFADVSRRKNETGGFYRRANRGDRNPEGSNYPDGFLPLINTTIWDFSFGAGLIREFANGLKADLGVVHGGNTFNFEITNSHNASWVNCRVGNPLMGDCEGFSGSGAAPTSADAGTLGLYLTTVNLDFSLPVPEKNLNLAWGAEYRRDNYRIEAGEEYSYADYDGSKGAATGIQVFPAFKPTNEVDESRHAFSFYTDAEMSVNDLGVLDKVMISPAVRYEHYSDFGHTLNGKLATKLDVSKQFALRGSMSSGFRAPSMHQLYFSSLSTQFITRGGQTVAEEVGTFRNNSAAAKAIGIPELKQETAISLSGGFVSTPFPSLTLTTDFYYIEVKDRIILSGTVKKEFLSADVVAELERVGASEGQFFMNAADTETRGLDIVASWDVPSMPRGSLTLNFLGSIMETKVKSVNLPAGLPPGLFTARDRSIIEEWQPKSRFTLSGLYKLDKFAASVAVHRYGSYTVTDDSGSVKQKFDPKYITDAQLSYDFGRFGILKIGANNLFDVTPDEDTIDTTGGVGSSTVRAISSWTARTCSHTRAGPRPSVSTAAFTTWPSSSGSRPGIRRPPAVLEAHGSELPVARALACRRRRAHISIPVTPCCDSGDTLL